MKNSKHLWRTLLFFVLLAALCGSFVFPVMDMPVSAAPQMQATLCTGTTFAQWTFENVITPSTGTGTFSSSGLSNPSFAAGNPGQAVSFTSWTSARDTAKYIELVVQTSGRKSIVITLDYRSTGTGPTTLELDYSTDGTNFALFNSPSTITNDSAFHSLSFDLSTIPGIDNNATTKFRLYGYGATNGSGTLRLDNLTFTGNCLTSPELTNTAAVNQTATASAVNATDTASAITGTASAVNATNTSSAITATASAVNATNTSIALTGTPTYTPTNTASPTSTSSSSATGVVISEFRTAGPTGANDEYIELYNPTSNWIDISGWKINASNNSGDVATRATIPVSTILRSGQYYLIANNGYSNTDNVTADLKYGTSISNDGGIGLIRTDNSISDEVGMDPGSAFQEGTTLPPLTNPNRSYERKEGDPKGSCVDTNNNSKDFSSESPSPHNYSTIRSCGGTTTTYSSLINTTTTITADTPDPSLINAYFSVSVKVINQSTGLATPSGKVNITGASTVCTINLNTSGTGSCVVKFTSTGSKTLTATYLGDNTHKSSSDTESHTVTSSTSYHTATPIPLPPPQLVVINEFVPRPGHDWNHDGVVNTGDEYIELLNHGTVDVNLSGWRLDDEVNIGSNPYSLPAKTIKPGERIVFFGSDTGLHLDDGGDAVRLLKPNGQLIDAYNYTIARYPDESFCRLPDNGGADDWNQYCFPTPGLQNSLSGNFASPPTNGFEPPGCIVSDTLPQGFVQAECDPFGNNIWNPKFWDRTGWYDEKNLPSVDGKWPVFAD